RCSSTRPRRAICGNNGMGLRRVLLAAVLIAFAAQVEAQTTRLSDLLAEDRRAPTAGDVAVLRAGARSQDPQTALIGVRGLGRLERPALIPDILPGLKSPLPEIRAEAANAIGQAAQGWKKGSSGSG